MSKKTVVIIGGGVAGISAAVRAIEAGWKSVLLERTSQLGGRARSMFAPDAGNYIDNGQHVLSANYLETRKLLAKIGSLEKIRFQKKLSIHFYLSSRRQFLFQSWPLPAPFHFLLPLWFQSPITHNDKKFIRNWVKIYRKPGIQQLKEKTVSEWLEEAGEGDIIEKLLWKPITLATLNTPPEKASAFLLYQVLEKAFLKNSRNCGLGLPAAYLGDIFGNPAQTYILKNGGEIRFNAAAIQLISENEKISAVETQKGERVEADNFILAIPPGALSRLVADSPGIAGVFRRDFSEFQYSPIITINVWLKNPIAGPFPIAFVDSPIQWVFPLPHPPENQNSFGYALVISAASAQVDLSNDELLKLADREFLYFFSKGLFDDYQIAASKIVKEKFATFLQTPEALPLRPATQTALKNLFLAGDWIDTELPATIESAVLSGRLAVEEMEKD